eukprot:scaffold28674_cov104-Isochrysis_galbana.AAC.3
MAAHGRGLPYRCFHPGNPCIAARVQHTQHARLRMTLEEHKTLRWARRPRIRGAPIQQHDALASRPLKSGSKIRAALKVEREAGRVAEPHAATLVKGRIFRSAVERGPGTASSSGHHEQVLDDQAAQAAAAHTLVHHHVLDVGDELLRAASAQHPPLNYDGTAGHD